MRCANLLLWAIACATVVAKGRWNENFGKPLDAETFCVKDAKVPEGFTGPVIYPDGALTGVDVVEAFGRFKSGKFPTLAFAKFKLKRQMVKRSFQTQEAMNKGTNTKMLTIDENYFIQKLEPAEVTSLFLNSIQVIMETIMLTRAVACVHWKGEVYVMRDYETQENICVDSDAEYPDKELNSKKKALRALFYSEGSTEIGAGSFGQVRAMRAKYNDLPPSVRENLKTITATVDLAVKKMLLAQTNVEELFVGEAFGNSPFGVKFYGCEFARDDSYGDHIFVAQELLSKNLDHETVRHRFVTGSDQQRFQFMIKLMYAMKSFHDLGFTHNDIKPSNIMLDARGQPKLIDYGMAARINGQNPGGFTPHFRHPHRRSADQSLPYFDTYSMLVTFVAMHLPKGEISLFYAKNPQNFELYEDRDLDTCMEVMQDFCINPNSRWAEAALTDIYGPDFPEQTDITQMNFTTLVLAFIDRLQIFTVDQIIKRMERLASMAGLRGKVL